MNILNTILALAEKKPDAAAVIQLYRIEDGRYREKVQYTYDKLINEAQHLAANLLHRVKTGVHVGVVMGNSPEWVVADIALLLAELVEVPVPLAFSTEQAAWLLHNCDIVLADTIGAERLTQWQQNGLTLSGEIITVAQGKIPQSTQPIRQPTKRVPQDTIIKVIHTSGTTSQPKGVQIRRHGLDALVTSLWQHAQTENYQRYLTLVPLSLLIEQVTALYMPLTSGGAVVMPPSEMPPLGSPV